LAIHPSSFILHPSGDERLRIGEDEIHVWFTSANLPPSGIELASRFLAEDELARAWRYRFEADQRRSIVSRASLRQLIGRYTDSDPGALRFLIQEHGKPALAGGGIEFNASHSGDVVVLAFARATPVGVDVEQVRPMPDALDIARRFFSSEETARLEGAAGVEEEFFTVWTLKEAIVKALGKGLSAGLDSFTVPARADRFTPISLNATTPELEGGWHVQTLPSQPGYRAAVASRGADRKVIIRPFIAQSDN
jgi:4'-phosphopantetheinyl transferase